MSARPRMLLRSTLARIGEEGIALRRVQQHSYAIGNRRQRSLRTMPLFLDADDLDLQDAERRLRQWTEFEQKALHTNDGAKAAMARRFVVEYTSLVAHLQKESPRH